MSHSDTADENPLRIAAVPAGHPYAQGLIDPDAPHTGRIVVLPDPQPAGAPAGQWWPPVVLDPEWIRSNTQNFDLVHVHFGTESFSLQHLQQVVDALRESGRPLVFTVHDLTNPQLTDQAPHLAQLDLLVRAADEVITLTPGAARVVRERWGREAVVIGHPMLAGAVGPGAGAVAPDVATVAARSEAATPHPATPRLTVGVHLRDLRPNIDALGTVDALLAAVPVLRLAGLDLDVVVDLNERVRDEAVRDELRRLVADAPDVRLREHPRLTDAELAADLAGIDIEVLPYRHGTHSGWLELCWDLGVAVAAPDVGFYGEQHAARGEVATFAAGIAGATAASASGTATTIGASAAGTAGSLAAALLELAEPIEAAHAAGRSRADRRAELQRDRAAWRLRQRRSIHESHLAVYRRALATVTV